MNQALVKDAQERLRETCLHIMELDLNAGGLAAVEMALCHLLEAQYQMKSLRGEWENHIERMKMVEASERLTPWSRQIAEEVASTGGSNIFAHILRAHFPEVAK